MRDLEYSPPVWLRRKQGDRMQGFGESRFAMSVVRMYSDPLVSSISSQGIMGPRGPPGPDGPQGEKVIS